MTAALRRPPAVVLVPASGSLHLLPAVLEDVGRPVDHVEQGEHQWESDPRDHVYPLGARGEPAIKREVRQ